MGDLSRIEILPQAFLSQMCIRDSTKDSQELARHAEGMGVDAIAAIPPIYFHLPEYAIAQYWNAISAAAPNTDFVIYNIPQLAGVALTQNLFAEMRKNPNVIGVKNSSMPVQDIQTVSYTHLDVYKRQVEDQEKADAE